MELIQGKADRQMSSTPRREGDLSGNEAQIFTPQLPHDQEEMKMMADLARINSLSLRFSKFKNILDLPNIDIEQLRKLSWCGIPDDIRPVVWKLLMVRGVLLRGIYQQIWTVVRLHLRENATSTMNTFKRLHSQRQIQR